MPILRCKCTDARQGSPSAKTHEEKHVQWTRTASERRFECDSSLVTFVDERQIRLFCYPIGQEVSSKQKIFGTLKQQQQCPPPNKQTHC